MPIDLHKLTTEPYERYADMAHRYLGSHALADFVKCPLLYRRRSLGMLPDWDSAALAIGRAAHTRILEGSVVFSERYAVGGPVNPKTGKPFGGNTKAFSEWADEQGKPVLTEDQLALIERLDDGVAQCPAAVDLLCEGKAEIVLRSDYCGWPCQARIDWITPSGQIADLKTCDELTWFEADAKRFGYIAQLAFYRSLLNYVCDWIAPAYLIAVEKREPNRCGVWRIDDALLNVAASQNRDAIDRLKLCSQTDIWPTGYEAVRVLTA